MKLKVDMGKLMGTRILVARYKTRKGAGVAAYDYRGIGKEGVYGVSPWGLGLDWVSEDSTTILAAEVPDGWWVGGSKDKSCLACIGDDLTDGLREQIGSDNVNSFYPGGDDYIGPRDAAYLMHVVPINRAVEVGIIAFHITLNTLHGIRIDTADRAIDGETWLEKD